MMGWQAGRRGSGGTATERPSGSGNGSAGDGSEAGAVAVGTAATGAMAARAAAMAVAREAVSVAARAAAARAAAAALAKVVRAARAAVLLELFWGCCWRLAPSLRVRVAVEDLEVAPHDYGRVLFQEASAFTADPPPFAV